MTPSPSSPHSPSQHQPQTHTYTDPDSKYSRESPLATNAETASKKPKRQKSTEGSDPKTPALISLSKHKYDLLITQFQRIKAQLATERATSKQLQHTNGELTNEVQKMTEKVELLEFNNKRLERRCAHLMTEMNEIHEQQKNDSFLSKITTGSGQIAPLKHQIEVLQEELQAKILENENIHIQIFEMKQQHAAAVQRMEHDIEQLMGDLQSREKMVREIRGEMEQQNASFARDRDEYQSDVFKLQEQLFRLRSENTALHQQLNRSIHDKERIERRMALRVPFDDIQHDALNIFNLPPHNRRLLQKHLQFQNYSKNSMLQLGKLFTALWATVLQKIAIVNNYADASGSIGGMGGVTTSMVPSFASSPSDSTSSHSYSPIIHYLYNHMQNNNEKIDVENQHFCSDLSSQFDFVITGLNAFIDFKSLNLSRIYEYREHMEKLLQMLAQYLQFLKHSMLYLVVSLQESKCSSKRQFGQNYVQFENIFMDESTELTRMYQQFALYMDELVDYFTDKLIMSAKTGAKSGNASDSAPTSSTTPNGNDTINTTPDDITTRDDDTRTAVRRKKRTKSVFSLPKLKKQKSVDAKSDSQDSTTTPGTTPTSANTNTSSGSTPRSRSMSNFFDSEQQLIIEDYITSEGTNPSPLNPQANSLAQKKDICLYLKQFCTFLKQFSKCIEAAIHDEHKLDFISSSIKSSNEKIIHFFSMIVSLMNRFHEYLQEYKQVERENMAAHVRGHPLDPLFWEPIIGGDTGVPKGVSTPKNAAAERNKDIGVKQPPYNLLANDGRAFMRLLDSQFQEDARSFDNISHSTALENRREIEHLHNERQHFENLTKKYKNAINEMIQNLRDVVTELSDGAESVESPTTVQHNNTLVEQEEKFEYYLQKVVDLFEEMQENLREELAKEARPEKEEFKISEEIIERENRMKKEYEKIIRHLEKQIKICDSKAVDFRIDWQKAVVQLEEAYRREKNLTFKVSETKQLLQKVQDELHTTRENYEKQNQLLTNSLLQLQQEKKNVSSGFSLEGLWSKK